MLPTFVNTWPNPKQVALRHLIKVADNYTYDSDKKKWQFHFDHGVHAGVTTLNLKNSHINPIKVITMLKNDIGWPGFSGALNQLERQATKILEVK